MKILLGVTGSIAAYKSLDIARALTKSQHQVRVILSKGALEFVKAETFRYLGCEEIYLPHDDFNPKSAGVLHIDLVKWADRLAICPLSANTLSKLAHGQCDDLLTSVALAWNKQKSLLLFPAMNTQMWNHPFTQEHIKKMQSLSFCQVIAPTEGLLACGDEGAGKLPDVSDIIELIPCLNPVALQAKHIVITTGATVAPIDPVRYVTNPSSGVTGAYIAQEFLEAGYQVTLIAGHHPDKKVEALRLHPKLQYVPAASTQDMLNAAQTYFPKADLYISAAAVADFEFDTADNKMKKNQLNQLHVKQAVDVLAQVLKVRKPHQKIISFAAETQTTEAVFREKMERKPVDLMVGNAVHSGLFGDMSLKGFQKNEGNYYFVLPKQTMAPQQLSKAELAHKLRHWYETGNLN